MATALNVVLIVFGAIVVILGIADAALIRIGFTFGPTHDSIILVVAGFAFVAVGLVAQYLRDEIRIPFVLAGASVGIWSAVVTELVARLIVENWYFVLAVALAQGPIVRIAIYNTYGGLVRSIVVDRMKDAMSLNPHKVRIAARLASQLPIEESAVYATQTSAIATALFMNELGFTVNSATTAAFLCAAAIGTLSYTFHAGVKEMRAFRENPRDFF